VVGHKAKTGYPHRRYSETVKTVFETFEFLAVAFTLVLIFRMFVVEPFQIPTGSMAESLLGEHYYMRCRQCGYKYNVGNDFGAGLESRCPSCGNNVVPGDYVSIFNGDRIMVYKCGYHFVDPKRWDVVVFKNPGNPQENYIKRLIAGPGETVEMIDGDVYINGKIVTKPPKVQQTLWLPVYDSDFPPLVRDNVRQQDLNNTQQKKNNKWQMPFKNEDGSIWDLQGNGGTKFSLDSEIGELNTMYYDTSLGNDFRATYAYNDTAKYDRMPNCSDLMARFYVSCGSEAGSVGVGLSKYESLYIGRVDFSGEMVIEKDEVALVRKQIDMKMPERAVLFKFSNVDHQLILEFGDEKLKCDIRPQRMDIGPRRNELMPQVKIFASGRVDLSHLALFKDIYYLDRDSGVLWAKEGEPFTLEADQFFVCGDNSPVSYDGRKWAGQGLGNNGVKYRAGIVPRDYLLGKAFVVYWGNAFRPSERLMPVIPNLGEFRFIPCGSDEQL